MTKAKKAISLIVSVVMLLGVLAVGVFANDNTGVAENGTIALSFDKASYSAGDTVKVTVKLTTDYYAATVSVPVQYDRSAVKFVSGTTASTLFGAGDATKTVVMMLLRAARLMSMSAYYRRLPAELLLRRQTASYFRPSPLPLLRPFPILRPLSVCLTIRKQ